MSHMIISPTWSVDTHDGWHNSDITVCWPPTEDMCGQVLQLQLHNSLFTGPLFEQSWTEYEIGQYSTLQYNTIQ
jgi:hypothetical protein